MGEYVRIKLPKNPWAISTIVLAAVLIVAIIFYARGNLYYSGNALPKSQAGANAVNFINSQTNSTVQLENVTEMSGVYEINLVYNGQSIPVYSTKDGKYLFQVAIPVQ